MGRYLSLPQEAEALEYQLLKECLSEVKQKESY